MTNAMNSLISNICDIYRLCNTFLKLIVMLSYLYMMRTIFISSFHSLISRNILSTDALKVLGSQEDVRAIIFVPNHKKEYFEKYFKKENVIIEGVNTNFNISKDKLFSLLASSLINTAGVRLRQERNLLRTKKYPRYFFVRALAIIFGKSRFIKKLVRFSDYRLMEKRIFERYFEKYNPRLVFVTDMFGLADLKLLATAKARGIPTVGMIRSWDNITNKGLFRLMPDKLVVHNELIKEEAILYEAVSSCNILVTGMPQFDEYLVGMRSTRREFFQKIGADFSKRLILFAPFGNRFHDADWQILQILKESITSKLIPSDVQFLVRFPPGDDVNLASFAPSKDFIIDRPGVSFQKGIFNDREMSPQDSLHLGDSLFHSNLVINYASTISIDAAVFDKPIILISFDGWEKRSYIESIKRFYDCDHMKAITKGSCCRIAHSKEDLVFWINRYLEDPAIDRGGREKLVREQLRYVDGKSGERLAKFLLKSI